MWFWNFIIACARTCAYLNVCLLEVNLHVVCKLQYQRWLLLNLHLALFYKGACTDYSVLTMAFYSGVWWEGGGLGCFFWHIAQQRNLVLHLTMKRLKKVENIGLISLASDSTKRHRREDSMFWSGDFFSCCKTQYHRELYAKNTESIETLECKLYKMAWLWNGV